MIGNNQIIQLSKTQVIKSDLSAITDLFKSLTINKDLFKVSFQQYYVVINGYDSDPRELYQIPEVIKFIAEFNESCPYWLYFLNPDVKKFFSWIIECLCNSKSVFNDDDIVYADFNHDKYNQLIKNQFIKISEIMNHNNFDYSFQEHCFEILCQNLKNLFIQTN